MIPVPDFILEEMAYRFGTSKDSLFFLGGGKEYSDGILYSYTDKDREKVLKILAIPVKEKEKALRKMDERLKFINFLGVNGVEIVYPLINCSNNLVELIEGDKHVFAGYIMYRVDGVHPSREEASPEFLDSLGRTIGRLHKVTKSYPKWKGSGPDGDCDVLGWHEEWEGFYQWCRDEDVKKQWLAIKKELLKLPVTRDTYGFIHNDPHMQNVMKSGERLILIDFDVANFHWFATDISIAAQSILFAKSGGLDRPVNDGSPIKLFFDNFMRGYEMENHLDKLFIEKMDLFIDYRRLLLFTVMQDWLESNPKVKSSWKTMILSNPGIASKILD